MGNREDLLNKLASAQASHGSSYVTKSATSQSNAAKQSGSYQDEHVQAAESSQETVQPAVGMWWSRYGPQVWVADVLLLIACLSAACALFYDKCKVLCGCKKDDTKLYIRNRCWAAAGLALLGYAITTYYGQEIGQDVQGICATGVLIIGAVLGLKSALDMWHCYQEGPEEGDEEDEDVDEEGDDT